MTITKQLLEAKLVEAMARRDERQAQLNAAVGAVNTLTHLLEVLELPEPPASPAEPATAAPPS